MPHPHYETGPVEVPSFPNASCRGMPFELFFGPEQTEKSHARKVRTEQAKAVCHGCDHRVDCLDWATRNPVVGIAGGMTVMERNRHRRQQLRQGST